MNPILQLVLNNADKFEAIAGQPAAYPNPASHAVTVEFEGTAGAAVITLSNTLGENLQTMSMPTVNGNNQVTLDLRSLHSGTYFVRVSVNGASMKTVPVLLTR